ncbi:MULTISPECIES: FCD domain-containing protein [Ensifer]|nr:FCD domain-containing protein [Ensifer sp. ENS02]
MPEAMWRQRRIRLLCKQDKDDLIDHARIGKIFYRPSNARMLEDLHEASRQHDEIIDAIANHGPDRAEALIRAHLDLSRKNMAMYAAPEGMAISLGV